VTVPDPTRWPLDFAALRRGDVLSADAMEAATGRTRDSEDYWRHLLRIKQMVVDYFEEAGDAGVIVTTRDDGLQILTDEEAAIYVQDRARKARKDFAWSVLKGSLVDRNKLTNETRASLDRWLIVNSFRLQQLRKTPPPELAQ
jgi:hypothetical protein